MGIVSGDHPEVVERVAEALNIDVALGSVTPEAKVAVIRESLRDHETVVMVGDGVNDSAALAAASIGVAVHNGAEASLAAAPVYLASEGLEPIQELLGISRSTCRTIRLNLAASLSYNVLAAGLAMLGWIHPLVAAVIMPISSITVVAISLTAGATATTTKDEVNR